MIIQSLKKFTKKHVIRFNASKGLESGLVLSGRGLILGCWDPLAVLMLVHHYCINCLLGEENENAHILDEISIS